MAGSGGQFHNIRIKGDNTSQKQQDEPSLVFCTSTSVELQFQIYDRVRSRLDLLVPLVQADLEQMKTIRKRTSSSSYTKDQLLDCVVELYRGDMEQSATTALHKQKKWK